MLVENRGVYTEKSCARIAKVIGGEGLSDINKEEAKDLNPG